jgi:hypothetical protein
MAIVIVEDGAVRVRLGLAERLLAARRRDIVIAKDAITNVEAVADILAYRRGLRMPGTGTRSIMLGTWRGTGGDGRKFKDFAAVHRPGPGVVVHASGADYDRVLLESDDAEALAARIRA